MCYFIEDKYILGIAGEQKALISPYQAVLCWQLYFKNFRSLKFEPCHDQVTNAVLHFFLVFKKMSCDNVYRTSPPLVFVGERRGTVIKKTSDCNRSGCEVLRLHQNLMTRCTFSKVRKCYTKGKVSLKVLVVCTLATDHSMKPPALPSHYSLVLDPPAPIRLLGNPIPPY